MCVPGLARVQRHSSLLDFDDTLEGRPIARGSQMQLSQHLLCRHILQGRCHGLTMVVDACHGRTQHSLPLSRASSPSQRYATSGPEVAADQSRQASLGLSTFGTPWNQW